VTVAADHVEALAEAIRSGPRVLPVAGGTKPGLSRPPAGEDVVALDVSGLRGITEYDPAELTLTALAGTPVSEVVDALAVHDQYLPFDPPLADAGATLGGVVAAGTSGANALRHGGVRDFVIGVKLLDGTGRLVSGGGKVVKNAAGFDLPKLMVGSLGSLGVMVQLSFKVFPRPRATTTLAFALPSRAAQLDALTRVNRGPVQVDALDLDADGVLVRLGGDAEALAARAQRLCASIDADVRRLDGTDDAAVWRDAAELSWVPAGSRVVRAALTLRDVPGLDAALAPFSALVRYSLSANLAWIAWPAEHDVAHLGAALAALGRTGVVVIDPETAPGRPRVIGAPTGGRFGSRVRSALDPHARFLEA
jgi:glycolate oxidase FAD binding subunit